MVLSRLLASSFLISSVALPIDTCIGSQASRASDNVAEQTGMPTLEVLKSPSSGCFELWITHIENNGFHVKNKNMENLEGMTFDREVRSASQSCHTAISDDDCVFEGYVLSKPIHQFLEKKPRGGIGLSTSGIHSGTHGRNAGDNFLPYKILIPGSYVSVEVYAQFNSAKEQVL